MMPQVVQGFIDNGMRSGIPKSDWASVVTVYEDASKIIEAIGNERPQSTHVVLLDKAGKIVWTTNSGYSAQQVMELKEVVQNLG
jgi:predicted transcriptional regulator